MCELIAASSLIVSLEFATARITCETAARGWVGIVCGRVWPVSISPYVSWLMSLHEWIVDDERSDNYQCHCFLCFIQPCYMLLVSTFNCTLERDLEMLVFNRCCPWHTHAVMDTLTVLWHVESKLFVTTVNRWYTVLSVLCEPDLLLLLVMTVLKR